MDAQLIKAVPIDDTDKGADKVLAYDQPADKLAYVPKCPEIVIKAIQHIAITILNLNTTQTDLINQVNIANTFLIFAGTQCNSDYPSSYYSKIELIDSAHVRATRFGSASDQITNISIVECTAGINTIQRGTVTLNGTNPMIVEINQVDTDKTFVSYLGLEAHIDVPRRALHRVYLSDSTHIAVERSGAWPNSILSYEVVEFI